jgi:hypothetical protein
MLMPLPTVAILLTLACAVGVASKVPSKLESVYTDLASAKCKTIETADETGNTTQKCNGVGGYHLLVYDDDSRQSITLVNARGKEYPLNYWSFVTHGFSSVGDKAEWRVSRENGRATPVALIVRVNASENPDNPKQITSYLAVAKISAAETCVTHRIAPGPKANEQARQAADASHSAPCLKEIGSGD